MRGYVPVVVAVSTTTPGGSPVVSGGLRNVSVLEKTLLSVLPDSVPVVASAMELRL